MFAQIDRQLLSVQSTFKCPKLENPKSGNFQLKPPMNFAHVCESGIYPLIKIGFFQPLTTALRQFR